MKQPVRIVFIINPASGSKKNKPGANYISQFFDTAFDIAVFESKNTGHATSLATEALESGAEAIVAVGGDGTVNEIARVLNGTSCALGIIPCGSGNGLARHHKISLNIPESINIIKRFNVVSHDAVSINGKLSFNVSGIGFDAHVAHLFGKDGKRGFSSYIKLVMKEFANYTEKNIRIESDSGVLKQPIMLAAIANASQFGNNACIAPAANTSDGITDITLVRKMSGWQLPYFAYNVFAKKVGNSPFAKLLQGDKFMITSDEKLPLHLDGEPAGFSKNFVVETMKGSLKIIVP